MITNTVHTLTTLPGSLSRFDTEAFFKEAARVLKPTGALAAWGYRLCKIPDNEQADQLLVHLSEVTFAPFWTSKRSLIQEVSCRASAALTFL